MVYVLLLYAVFVVVGCIPSWEVSAAAVKAVQPLAMVVVGFYFGGRSVEKMIAIGKKPSKS
jgi:hypothetical protein